MKRFPHTWTATVAAAALLGTLAFSAQAQTPAPQGHHSHASAAAPHQTMAQKHADRMEPLKNILQLQAQQQAAFEQYVQATMPQPQSERPDLRKLTTPERLDWSQKLRKERTAKAEQREQATLSFYRSLSSSQQKAFDAWSTHSHGKHRRHAAHQGKGKPHHAPAMHVAVPAV